MRFRLALLACLAALAALVPAAPAQAPASATAGASIASGGLGDVGVVRASGSGRDRASERTDRPGLTIARGRASAEAATAGGNGSAEATARAEGVSLFDGLVTAEAVERTASAAGGEVALVGFVTGLSVDGVDRGDISGTDTFSAGGARVTVNAGGDGLRVRLTRPVAGFASGTEVVVASVEAGAEDGTDPAAPSATPAPAPADPLDPLARDPAPRAQRTPRGPSAAERLERARYVFPVYGDVRCADDFGGPRQIGPHQGNDCFAAFGSPVLAVADGTLNRVGTLPISGNRFWLESDDGDSFFYAHLSAFAPAAVEGAEVKAGTLLGFIGNTGDAEPTPPHLHFEIHPGADDDKAIDPHAILLAWQRNGELPSGGWLARFGGDTEERPGALVEVRDLIAEG